MALKSDLVYYSLYGDANAKKYSTSPRNDGYREGFFGAVHVGIPDILWDKVVFVGERQFIWTHGVLFYGSSVVDNELSETSDNAVANSAVANALNGKMNAVTKLTVEEYESVEEKDSNTLYVVTDDDGEPQSLYVGSVPVLTGNVKIAIDNALDPESTNPLENRVIASLLGDIDQRITSVRTTVNNVDTAIRSTVNKVSSDLQQHVTETATWKSQTDRAIIEANEAIEKNAEDISNAQELVKKQGELIQELSDHTDASRDAVLRLNERVTEAERKAGEAKELSQQSARDSLSSQQSSNAAQAAAVEAAQAAAVAEAKAAAVAEAIGNLNANPDTSMAGQVLQNTADIAALKEKTSARNPNVSLELDDDGDLILTTAEDSAVVGGEMDEDGNVLLNILLM